MAGCVTLPAPLPCLLHPVRGGEGGGLYMLYRSEFYRVESVRGSSRPGLTESQNCSDQYVASNKLCPELSPRDSEVAVDIPGGAKVNMR